MRKIVLYSYYINEDRLSQTVNMNLERDIVNLESRNERELVFATGNHSGHNFRVSIAQRSGEVYYDHDQSCYRVWFDEPDRNKAVEAIGNYILDRILPEIRTHKSFIKRLEDERLRAMKLLDSLPEV